MNIHTAIAAAPGKNCHLLKCVAIITTAVKRQIFLIALITQLIF